MFDQPMLQPDAMQGKTVLITGGGTGLGRSIGTYLLELGANLVITGRREEVLTQAAQEMSESTGGAVLPVAGDVRNYDQVVATIAAGYEKFGKIDALINNAAGNFISPTERLSYRAFEAVIGIVLQGSINYTLELGKRWIADQDKGTVLSVSTTYADTGSGYVVPSACAKSGLNALTRSLAAEWGSKYGIRLNAVAPGPFPTKGAWDRLFPEDLKEKFDFTKRIPFKRTGEHQELANLCAFLVSDYSSYINGQVISIDAGETVMGGGQFNMLSGIPEPMWDMIEQTIRKNTRKK
ncbi:MAG: SDR family oxidoreductase [Bernardetiaceae bacterium]